MSSDIQSQSTSRNLVRISGLGYRENVDLQEAGRREQAAQVLLNNQDANLSATGIHRAAISYLSIGRQNTTPPVL